ncbi:MAG: hypothetical protein IT214_00010 [Chitinophagaceae bacterium]|nr:hypothetical protein [Chitinophagaceae bacterium]
MEKLTREQLKMIKGGDVSGASGCGVLVNGNWHPSGQSASATQGLLGYAVNGYDNVTWWSNDGGSSYIQGAYSGTVTRWCCDHCPWNLPGYA